jgi:hypothetical protein
LNTDPAVSDRIRGNRNDPSCLPQTRFVIRHGAAC